MAVTKCLWFFGIVHLTRAIVEPYLDPNMMTLPFLQNLESSLWDPYQGTDKSGVSDQYGYGYSYAPSYAPPSYPAKSYEPAPSYEPSYPAPSYEPSYPAPSYEPSYQPSYPAPSYPMQSYAPIYAPSYAPSYIPHTHRKEEKEKIYVPVMVRRKKKKMKIISIQKGFYIPGGTQLFGKYKNLKSCQKACAATPNCFAGDYNPWLKKCYVHSHMTACTTVRSHKKIIHFKKVPCSMLEAPESLVILGMQIPKGIEQKGIKSLTDCIKKCATAGSGIPADVADIDEQICFGIDYDFGSHKCYFHVVNAGLCPANGGPIDIEMIETFENPGVIAIILCPGPSPP